MATREDLILAHLPQVKVIARSIRKRLPLAASVATDDLISIGTLGLIAAVDSYDAAFHTQLKRELYT